MVFNSYVFVLLFLPLALAFYFTLGPRLSRRASQLMLIGISLLFYAPNGIGLLLVMCSAAAANYLLSRLLVSGKTDEKLRKLILFAGIAMNVALLAYCKYLNFFIETANRVLVREYALRNIILPVGLSYYTFQHIAYLVDSYRMETADDTFMEYFLFSVWFPKIIQGPILLREDMLPALRDDRCRCFDADNFASGLYLFAVGIFKKIIVSDVFAGFLALTLANKGSLSSAEAFLTVLGSVIQLYFDFSAYCDMACGISVMFNLELPQNFNSPLKALSLSELWSRWHITLMRFLRKYVYFPLGGSRKGELRTYLNIMIIFLLSGIWHGADWTFILWGLCHGVLSCFERAFAKQRARLPAPVRLTITFLAFTLLYVTYYCSSVGEAVRLIGRMFIGGSGFDFARYAGAFNVTLLLSAENALSFGRLPAELLTVFNTLLYFAISMAAILFGKNAFESSRELNSKKAVLTGLMLAVSVLSLSNVSAFLYAQF